MIFSDYTILLYTALTCGSLLGLMQGTLFYFVSRDKM